MSEAEQLFNEFLFGAGSWIGIILIVGLIVLITSKERYAGLLFFPIIILLSLKYLEKMNETGNLAWQIIVLLFASIFILLKASGKLGDKH